MTTALVALNDTRRLPQVRSRIKLAFVEASERVPIILNDARSVQQDAIRLLETGDVRDAAEKAWCATKRSTDALILARTGEEPETSSDTSGGLLALASGDDSMRTLVRRYYSRQRELHGACFYLGDCELTDDMERRIRQTSDYIRDAEYLAGVN